MSNQLESITFAESQQAAALGHALKDPEVWESFRTWKIEVDWFKRLDHREVYRVALIYAERNSGRGPTPKEVEALYDNLEGVKDGDKQQAFVKTLSSLCRQADNQAWDPISTKMSEWASVSRVRRAIDEWGRNLKQGKAKEAVEVVQLAATEISGYFAVKGGAEAVDRFRPSSERIEKEEEIRQGNKKDMLQYGIRFLDDQLIGIVRDDLIICGAETGGGKTQLASLISEANVLAGKKVYVFCLELADKQYEQRIQYRLEQDILKKRGVEKEKRPEWAKWMYGLEDSPEDVKKEAREILKDKFRNLHTFYHRDGDFKKKDLERRIIQAVNEGADLIVLDHLHYIDRSDYRQSEHEETETTMKWLRQRVITYKVPFLIVSHLRKSVGKEVTQVVRGADAYHGSSAISKVATTCIMLAHARGIRSLSPKWKFGSPTYLSTVKWRTDGSRCRYVGVQWYDSLMAKYSPEYLVGNLTPSKDGWSPADRNPDWARPSHELLISLEDVKKEKD